MANTKVTSRVLADDAVLTANITDANVTTAKIAADAITGAKIADDAINSEHYTDGSIDTAHIADDQVTLAKMAGLARGKIIYGDSSGNPAALALGSNGQILKSDGTDISWGAESTFDTDAAQVFNESGAAVDFRIEGDTDANLFFLDGSEDKIGIGTNAPTSKLHLENSASNAVVQIGFENDAQEWRLGVHGGLSDGFLLYDNTNSASRFFVGTDGKVGIGTTSPLSHLTFESDHWNTGTEDGPSIRWNNGITTADSVLQNFEDGNVAPFVLGMNSFVSSGGSFTTFNNSYAASYLYLGSSGAITFGTSSSGTATERMQIKNSGEVLIGTQTAVSNAKLTVDGGDMMVHGANNSCGMSDLLPGYTRGDYGVVLSTANHVYFVVGSSYVSYINGGNGTFNVSDQRLKENVATLTGTLDKVKQLRGVSFTWKDTEERGTDTAIGLIAQEVEAVYPQLVDDGGLPKDNDGNDPLKSVNYAHLTSVLIEAIKELSTELDAAKARITTLEG